MVLSLLIQKRFSLLPISENAVGIRWFTICNGFALVDKIAYVEATGNSNNDANMVIQLKDKNVKCIETDRKLHQRVCGHLIPINNGNHSSEANTSQVFADRDAITSDVWHQDLVLRKGERYLIEAASGTGKSSLCSYIYGYRRDYQGIINFDERNIRSLSIHEWVELRKHSLEHAVPGAAHFSRS